MATYYVDSNATGLDDGSSWTDAWASLASSLSVAAGDTVLVSSSHNETITLNARYDYTNATSALPVKVISTNSTTGLYEKATSIQIDNGTAGFFDIIFERNAEFHGLYVRSNDLHFNGEGSMLLMNDCTFTFCQSPLLDLGDSANGVGICKFTSCLFDFSGGTGSYNAYVGRATIADFIDCNFVKYTASYLFKSQTYEYYTPITFTGCDLSVYDTIYSSVTAVTYGRRVVLERCKTKAGFSVFSSISSQSYDGFVYESSDSASLSSRVLGLVRKESYAGVISSSTSVYRSSGSNDGDNDFSWSVESTASCGKINLLDSIEICKSVESGSQTITVYVAGSASLNDDDFWIEVESPSEEVSPTARGKFRATKPDPLATPTALTSDTSSTWNGTGAGTKQKIEVAISPTIAGTVTVRCYLAKPSTTVYVDPKISETGNQRVFDGVLVDGPGSTGGGATHYDPFTNPRF